MHEVLIIVCETWVNFPTGHFSPPSEPHKTYNLPGVKECATTHGIYILHRSQAMYNDKKIFGDGNVYPYSNVSALHNSS